MQLHFCRRNGGSEMKLSKDDLSFALNCAKQYYYDSLNSDYPRKDDQKNEELFRDLEQEADNDTLEIEGYERVKTAMKGDFAPDANDVEKLKVWVTENDIAGGLQLTVGELKDRFRKLSIENEQLKIRNVNLHHSKEVLISKQSEVDGERVQWTKFDQNDESTFPPCEGVYLVCRGVEPYFREAKFYGEKVGFGDTCVILWRPLPKLPLEIDGRYIREDRPECFYSERKVCK